MDEVTVLIPAYNREKYIQECVWSALGQTHPHLRVLIYDDGSTDETVKRILDIRRNLPLTRKKQIEVISDSIRHGVGFARNYLLKRVKTPYACWLDSDDLMASNRVEKQLAKIKAGPFDIVFSYLRRFSVVKKKREYRDVVKIDVEKYSDFNSLRFNTACASGFFRRELQQYDFDTRLTLGSEDVIWLYSLLKANKKVGLVPEVLYFYRFHGQRIGRDKAASIYQKRKNEEHQLIAQIIREIKR